MHEYGEDDFPEGLDESSTSRSAGLGRFGNPGPLGLQSTRNFPYLQPPVLGLGSELEDSQTKEHQQDFTSLGWAKGMAEQLQEALKEFVYRSEIESATSIDPKRNTQELANSICYWIKKRENAKIQRILPGMAMHLIYAFNEGIKQNRKEALNRVQKVLIELKSSGQSNFNLIWKSLKAVSIDFASPIEKFVLCEKLDPIEDVLSGPPDQNKKDFVLFYRAQDNAGAATDSASSEPVAATSQRKPRQAPKTYIQFQFVLDATDEPIAGLSTRVTLPDGIENFYRTNNKGQIHIKDIEKGICDIKCDLKKPELKSTGAFLGSGAPAKGTESTKGIKTIANIEAHKVSTGETIGGLADENGISWQDLSFFNWGTSKPREINKALALHVGCTKKTKDGNNYMFNSADDPGILYIPTPWEKEGLSTGSEHVFRIGNYSLKPKTMLVFEDEEHLLPEADFVIVGADGKELSSGKSNRSALVELPEDHPEEALILLGKLHTINCTVLSAGDRLPVENTDFEVTFSSGRSLSMSTDSSGSFVLENAPEGNIILSTDNAEAVGFAGPDTSKIEFILRYLEDSDEDGPDEDDLDDSLI